MKAEAADLIRRFCEKHGDKYDVYENYSGRGMSGRLCIGIAVRRGNPHMYMLAELMRHFLESGSDECFQALADVSVDSLGLDTIVYFPQVRG